MFVPKPYIDPATGMSRCFVPATVYDNPSIMVNDPDYVRRLESLPEIERLRFLHGVWDVFEGQVFPELSDHIHGYDDFKIPPEWEKFGAFDWGYSKPWAYLMFAVDFDGIVYVFREVYGAKHDTDVGLRQTNQEITQAIIEAEKGIKLKYRVADPNCWAPTKSYQGKQIILGPSFIEDASRDGVFFLKADNDRIRGKQQIHQRLQIEEITDEAGEVLSEHPRLHIARSCVNWWRTLMALREDPGNPEDVETDKQPDHLYDCTRYGLMSRPFIPKRQIRVAPGSFQAERDRFIRAKKYAAAHSVSIAAA
jgi:hypothetical protein